MQWLDDVMSEEYQFVKTLKDNDKTSIIHYRHKKLGQDIIKITYRGDVTVYKILQGITHRNLPRIYDVLDEQGTCTVLEEFIDGMTVGELLKSGLYEESGVRHICSDICDALWVLHSYDIIHRDIKPENIMISNDGRAVLIDFDAARIYKPYKSADTFFTGTAGYAAPEQYGVSQSDPRSDIFALGVLMNVMLTGQHPSKKMYEGKLSRVIEKCIKVDPNMRYANAVEVKSDL
jgi:serine/threonine protein kinase